MVVTALAVDASRPDQDQLTLWFDLAAFGKLAELLARHQKGDLVSVSGSMTMRQWEDADGATRQAYNLTADALVSARTARPSGGRRRQSSDIAPADAARQGPPDFDDELPR